MGLWAPTDFCLLVFIRKEDQIKKDEQFARVLQEQEGSSSTSPETRCSDLSPQTRVSGDQQGSEQVRIGQVQVEMSLNIRQRCSSQNVVPFYLTMFILFPGRSRPRPDY